MYIPRQIVVPIDFSEPSRAAVWRALGLARAFAAPIHLVHALRYSDIAPYGDLPLPPAAWDELREQARKALLSLENELANEDGVPVSSALVEGDPVSAIEAAVAERGANLVVMGSHGHSGIKHVALGSVAERAFRSVDCPILAVKESETGAKRPIERILFATDFSTHSKRAAMLACGLAQQLSARVELIHVFMLPGRAIGPYGIPPSAPVVAELRERAQELLTDATHVFSNSQVPVKPHLEQGLPSEVLSRKAEELRAELIVMGTRGNTGLKHVFLGSVTERTLRSAPCSVLTTKDGDPI